MDKQNCNFCHKSENEVKRLIVGPNNLGACDECLACLALIMAEVDSEWRVRLVESLKALQHPD
jgi:ATP-dependent protease Clp ATPase subunit